MTKNLFCFAVFALSIISNDANAFMRYSLVGGFNLDKPKSANSYSANTGYLAGGFVESNITFRSSFEFGLLWYQRKFSDSTGYRMQGVHLPLVFRYWLLQVFNVGVGGYFSQGIGLVSFSPKGSPEQVKGYSEAGLKASDYGLLGSAQINLRMTLGTSLFFDVRYLKGLISSPRTSLTHQETQGIIGIRFLSFAGSRKSST